jgi:hypothetical protein
MSKTEWCPVCGGALSLTSWYEAVCMRRVESGGCGAHYVKNAEDRWQFTCTAEHRRGGESCLRSTG